MRFDARGFTFWLISIAILGLEEAWAAFSGHTSLTLSYQVWWLVSYLPLPVAWLAAAAFGASGSLLVIHFASRRPEL